MRALIAVLLLVSAAGAQPTRINCGPVSTAGGPATASQTCRGLVATTTTTLPATPLNLPTTNDTDTNCPTTVPAQAGANPGSNSVIVSRSCATGANANGYDVQSLSPYVGGTTAGSHIICTVYNYPSPYTSGTSSIAKVNAGCDSAPSSGLSTPNAYVTLPVAGPCHLAPGTRYFLGCNADDNVQVGYVNGCSNCWQVNQSQTYPALPTPWVANNQLPIGVAIYATVVPSP